MSEILTFVFFLFVFIYISYVKSRIDETRDEVRDLRLRFEAKNREKEPTSQASADTALELTQSLTETGEIPGESREKPLVGENNNVEVEIGDGNGNFEFKLGGKFFTGVGVVAIICAVGFFLRYAFENDLINEFGRVALGVFVGLILLVIGEVTRKKFPNYGQALTGGGLGVLYVSFYAAFSFYGLMAQPMAFFAMILVTGAGILLSLRQNSIGLAMFAQIGGFLTPLLINSGSSSPHVLFLYVILLDLAIFLTAFYKLWQPLSLTGIIGTAITYAYWHMHFYAAAQFLPAFLYLSLFFAIFLCIPFIQYFVKKALENSWDLLVTTLSPLLYFWASYSIIDPLYPEASGLFTAALGIFYCMLAMLVGEGRRTAPLFRHFLLSSGFILLAIAVPVQFESKWVIIAWAAEALVFIVTGFKMKFGTYRFLGNGLLLMTLFRILVFEGNLPFRAQPFFNDRFLAYAAFFIAAASAAYIYRRHKQDVEENEKSLFSILAMGAAFAGLFGFTLEIHDFFEGYWYPILWSAGGLLAGWLSFKLSSMALRCVTYITLTFAFFRLLFFETHINLADYNLLFNTRVLAFVISAMFGRIFLSMLRTNKEKVSLGEYNFFQPVLFLYFHFLGLWIMSAEIINYCNQMMIGETKSTRYDLENLKNVLLSAAWTIYGVILMVWGIFKKTTYERFTAITLFIIVIIKVFLVDTANLGDLYRFFSFIILGGFLLLTGYLYYRYQNRIREFVKGE